MICLNFWPKSQRRRFAEIRRFPKIAKQLGGSSNGVQNEAPPEGTSAELFQEARSKKKRNERKIVHGKLFEKVGRLKVGNDWLKKRFR